MLFLLFFAQNLLPERLELVGGYGDQTENSRIALDWDILQRDLKKWPIRINLNLTANYSKFKSKEDQPKTYDRLTDYGLTPVFTITPQINKGRSWTPFVEFGIGYHHLSRKGISNKTFSTHFQFGDHIGFGLYLDPQKKFKVSYVFQHLSNGGIGSPNPGINFHLATIGLKLPIGKD